MKDKMQKILAALNENAEILAVSPFCSEEDGEPYQVWKLDTQDTSLVLKQASAQEWQVYQTFFSEGGPAPKIYAMGEYDGQSYLLMEYIDGISMSRCTRPLLVKALDALIASQEPYWEAAGYDHAGYDFETCYASRQKRLQYMGDLSEAYQAYLDQFAILPRTLCHDDLLPFNVLVGEERAVILDWEYAGMLPYPCALARLLAFGEEDPNALFQMTGEDRQFALDYYYEHLIRQKGISRQEYDRTMQLFFFKEYSEWVYCAAISGDYEMDYYKKYYPVARKLAQELGY